MKITVVSFKGGVGKTTTAIHLAACLQSRGSTALVDGDLNRSATEWASGGHLPFDVLDWTDSHRAAREFKHTVVDTQARPGTEDLRVLAGACDLLVIPSTPDALALSALMKTVGVLDNLGATRYRVLLTIIPPAPSKDGDEARAMLKSAKLPHFARGVRRLSAFTKAALAGVLVKNVANDPRAIAAWEDYEAVGREIKA